MMSKELKIEISKKVFNKAYLPFIDNEDRFLLFYGGGSSGKSYFIVQRYIVKLLNQKCNLLVVRNTADSNRKSTFALFKQIINKWGLKGKVFKVNESDMKIKNLINGNEVAFAGLDDVEKLKSITFENGECTDIWVEEATECSESDINQLKIRQRGGKSKKQMVLSFNPVDINHWIKKHFIDSKLATVIHTTYKDNDFLTEEDKQVLEAFKATDPYYYMVYCLGQWGVYGKTIFNAQKISERLSKLIKPIKVGFFKYKEYYNPDKNKMLINDKSIEWVDDPDGYIKVYEEVKKGYPYVIGGDTAGEGSDNFTGQVLNNNNGNQVAVLKHQFDEDIYAKQMYCLGNYYNKALIGIETNYSTHPNRVLEDLEYQNLYVREREDNFTHGIVKAFGFQTTSKTRPIIIAGLVEVFRDDINSINDKDTLEEGLTFVRNEKGRPEAQNGAHDDLIMAKAIAHYIRPQQRYLVLKDTKKQRELDQFELMDVEEETSYQETGVKLEII